MKSLPAYLRVLTPADAQIVLEEMLREHPKLSADARRIVDRVLSSVSCKDVARRVFDAVQALDLDDMKAGPSLDGYIEPCEAASQMIEDTMEPFFVDLRRRMTLRRTEEALEVCKGIVAGL